MQKFLAYAMSSQTVALDLYRFKAANQRNAMTQLPY